MQLIVPSTTQNLLNNDGYNLQLSRIDTQIQKLAEAQYRNLIFGFTEPVDLEVYEFFCEQREVLLNKYMGCECISQEDFCANYQYDYANNNCVNPLPIQYTRTCTIRFVIKDTPDPSVKYRLCNGVLIPGEYTSGFTLIPYLAGRQVQGDVVVDNMPRQEIVFDENGQSNTQFYDGNTVSFLYEEVI